MSKLRFLVSLITKENDYQVEQAAAALTAAKEIGVDVDIVYADNDPITQSTQVLKAIQAEPSQRPNGIVIEPLGATAFPQAAQAAVSAGIGWAVLSRRADYAKEMGKSSRPPVFSVSVDQVEVGRIQARQVMALLPRGGTVLFIQGPSVSSVSKERHDGLMELLPSNVHLTNLRGRWTEESAYQSVCSWFKLMTAQKARIDLVLAQNDVMGMGARKAIEETVTGPDRDDWLEILITATEFRKRGKLGSEGESLRRLSLCLPAPARRSGLWRRRFGSPPASPSTFILPQRRFPKSRSLLPKAPKDDVVACVWKQSAILIKGLPTQRHRASGRRSNPCVTDLGVKLSQTSASQLKRQLHPRRASACSCSLTPRSFCVSLSSIVWAFVGRDNRVVAV